MKIYVAARFDDVRASKLVGKINHDYSRDYKVTFRWWEFRDEEKLDELMKKGQCSRKEALKLIGDMERFSVVQSNVLVYIANDPSRGASFEMGIAAAVGLPIIIYDCDGKYAEEFDRSTFFQNESIVVRATSMDDLDKQLFVFSTLLKSIEERATAAGIISLKEKAKFIGSEYVRMLTSIRIQNDMELEPVYQWFFKNHSDAVLLSEKKNMFDGTSK